MMLVVIVVCYTPTSGLKLVHQKMTGLAREGLES